MQTPQAPLRKGGRLCRAGAIPLHPPLHYSFPRSPVGMPSGTLCVIGSRLPDDAERRDGIPTETVGTRLGCVTGWQSEPLIAGASG